MTVLYHYKTFGFQDKQMNVCNDPVFLAVFQREELQFGSERSNRRFVRTKLGPPGWPFQDVLTLHDCRPQVFVELKHTRNRPYLEKALALLDQYKVRSCALLSVTPLQYRISAGLMKENVLDFNTLRKKLKGT